MRNTYEAYILVQLRDGRKFVCALNRKKQKKLPPQVPQPVQETGWDLEVVWN